MADHKQAKKRIRRNERARIKNHARTSRMRTFIKKIETAIEAGDQTLAKAAYKDAQPEIHRAASKGLIHKNAAARKLSRLSKRINSLAA